MNLHHIAVTCSSIENADGFYKDVLGLEKTKDSVIKPELTDSIFGIAAECRLLLYSGPDFIVEVFIPRDEIYRKPAFEHICLSVKDRQAFVETCRAGGCDIKLIPRGDYHLTFIRDFDGNLFEIKETA